MRSHKENIRPLSRSNELAPLSREHHDGLLLCWKINTGITNKIPLTRIRDYVLYFFKEDLELHFAKEEKYLFPLLESNNELRMKAEKQHDEMRKIIDDLSNSAKPEVTQLMRFSEALRIHIRFEERELFNIIQDTADTGKLRRAGKKLEGVHRDCDLSWPDHFWTK